MEGEESVSDQMETGENQDSVRKVSEASRSDTSKKEKQGRTVGKGDKRYWLQKGKLISDPRSSALSCKIQVQGRRESFPLRTANKAAAAEKAAQIYNEIVVNGWVVALAKYKPSKAPKAATVGALIEANEKLSSAQPQTLHVYAQALRRIVAGIKGWDSDPRKLDAFQGGNVAWRARIDAVRLDELTPGIVTAWKAAFLNCASTPEERASASVTVNSLVRNAKALMSRRMLSLLSAELNLPSPLPFDGVPMEKRPKLRYESKIDARQIMRSAKEELAVSDPEAFKLLLLTLGCGLRRSEADNLLWEQVDFERSIIQIRHTEIARLKSDDSAGEVDMDERLCTVLKGFREKARGQFVLETPPSPGLGPKRQKGRRSKRYRCEPTHRRLITWLRQQGVTGKRPIHTLRKEVGSIIASGQGIYAASRFLRHADIQMTSAIYSDKKLPVTSGIGELLFEV